MPPATTRKRVSEKVSLILCPALSTHISAGSHLRRTAPWPLVSPPLCPSALEKHLAPEFHSPVMPVFPWQELPTFSLTWGPGSSTEWWDSGSNRVLDRKRPPVKGWFAELACISEQVQTSMAMPCGLLRSGHM